MQLEVLLYQAGCHIVRTGDEKLGMQCALHAVYAAQHILCTCAVCAAYRGAQQGVLPSWPPPALWNSMKGSVQSTSGTRRFRALAMSPIHWALYTLSSHLTTALTSAGALSGKYCLGSGVAGKAV